jgi:hypothetical protein
MLPDTRAAPPAKYSPGWCWVRGRPRPQNIPRASISLFSVKLDLLDGMSDKLEDKCGRGRPRTR